ncbi:MAG: tetratricopeptide repeat protein [bacterium]|nr:tetratricopeptide repeat protein [bacterium]
MRVAAATVILLATQALHGSEALKTQGAEHFEKGRYLESTIAYKKADLITPLDNRSRFTLVTAYIALERGHWARPELEKLIAADPFNPVYPYWLARVYYTFNWFDEAVEELDKALALDPDFAAAYDRLGLCLEGLGNNEAALARNETAVRLNQESGESAHWPAYHLGSLLHDLGQLEKAEKSLRRALRAAADMAEAHYELGVVLDKRGKSREAVKQLLRAAELDESDPQPHYALSQIYRRLGDREKAMEEIRRFRELSKGR